MYISLIAFYQFQSCPLIIQNVTRWYLVRLVHRGDIIICLALQHNIHLPAYAHKVIKSLFTSICVCFYSSRFTSLTATHLYDSWKVEKEQQKKPLYPIKFWNGFTLGLLCKSSYWFKMTATKQVYWYVIFYHSYCYLSILTLFRGGILCRLAGGGGGAKLP